jgi:hypothetical protein
MSYRVLLGTVVRSDDMSHRPGERQGTGRRRVSGSCLALLNIHAQSRLRSPRMPSRSPFCRSPKSPGPKTCSCKEASGETDCCTCKLLTNPLGGCFRRAYAGGRCSRLALVRSQVEVSFWYRPLSECAARSEGQRQVNNRENFISRIPLTRDAHGPHTQVTLGPRCDTILRILV